MNILSNANEPSGSHKVVLAIALVAGLAELSYAVMNVSAMPVYLTRSMGYTTGSMTAIGAAFLLCEGLAKGPFGILGDRIGRKRLIIAGPLISVITSLLTIFIHPSQWYFFVMLRVLDGLGAAALWPSALAMIADVIEEDKRSQAMSLFNVTYMIGIALGPLLGGAANDLTAFFTQQVPEQIALHGGKFAASHVQPLHLDPRQASFYVISVLFLITALVAAWRIPDIKPHHERHPLDLENGFNFRSLVQSLKKAPAMLLMSFVTFFGVGMVMLIIKVYALDEFKITEVQFGALLLPPCLVIALASIPLGTLGDKIGRAKAVRIGIGVCALSLWGLILTSNPIALIIGGSMIGVGFVIAFPAWMAYISSSCEPGQRGAVMGAVGTAQGAGAIIGAPLGGFLYDQWHLLPFLGCASLLIIAWLIAMFYVREQTST